MELWDSRIEDSFYPYPAIGLLTSTAETCLLPPPPCDVKLFGLSGGKTTPAH